MRGSIYILLIGLAITGFSQHIGFGFGGNFPTLTFKSADGASSQQIRGIPGVSAQVSYSHDLSKKSKGFSRYRKEANQLMLAVGYESLSLEDIQSTVQSSWKAGYLTSLLGLRSTSGGKKKTGLLYSLGASMDYLVTGSQVIGFEQYNLTQVWNRMNLSAMGELGLNYSVSNESYTTISISYERGLSNLEKDAGQEARLHTWRISIAIHFKK